MFKRTLDHLRGGEDDEIRVEHTRNQIEENRGKWTWVTTKIHGENVEIRVYYRTEDGEPIDL